MSLLHRVSSTESIDRSSTGDRAQHRKLSFNPLSNEAPPALGPVGAYEVPLWKRITQVVIAVVYCLLAAGVVFGYAALKQVLISEGVYRDRCTKDELKSEVPVCRDQELRLNLMFTVAAVSTNMCALPIGIVLDRFGPRVATIIGACLVTIGLLFLGLASEAPFDAWMPGYFFLALGGPFVYMPTFHLSNTFPRYSGLILALVTGAFDTSSAIFLLYRLAYERSGNGISTKAFFLSYLVVPVFIIIMQITVMPKNSYKSVGELVKTLDETPPDHPSQRTAEADPDGRRESTASEITSLLGSKDAETHAQKEEQKQSNSGVWGALHGKTAWQQIKTPWFVLIALFAMVQMLRINYFVATIRPQYEYFFKNPGKAKAINDFFDAALPIGGLVAVPFIGVLLDNANTSLVLAVMVFLTTAIGVLGLLPYMGAAYTNIVLFVLFRPFYYTTVSDYSAKVFGFYTFGKVYGLVICLAGVFNFAQYGLDSLTQHTFNMNPVPINSILLGVGLILGIALVSYCYVRSKHIRRELLEEEAEAARPLLMPGADERALEDHHPIDVHRHDDIYRPTDSR